MASRQSVNDDPPTTKRATTDYSNVEAKTGIPSPLAPKPKNHASIFASWRVTVCYAICVVALTAFVLLATDVVQRCKAGIGNVNINLRGDAIEGRASRLLDSVPWLDGHDDLGCQIRQTYQNKIYGPNFTNPFESGNLQGHIDLYRLRKGKAGGAFWSAWVDCPDSSFDFSETDYAQATLDTHAQLDLLKRLHSAYRSDFAASTLRSHQQLSLFKQNHTLLAPLSLEGLHQVHPSVPLSTLRLYHELGVRMITLTHNCHNPYADAAIIPSGETGDLIPAPSRWGGISPAGRQVIHEMNRLGVIVDVSHTSHEAQLQAMTTSKAPLVYSHSSAFAICPHPRNVKDSAFELVRKTRSVIMANFAPDHISCEASPDPKNELPAPYDQNNTLHQVVRHILYLGANVGWDHVGIGSDFDGIPQTPRGIKDVSDFPKIVQELLRTGLDEKIVGNVVGGNVLRVWAEVEETAESMRDISPGEDQVSKFRQA